jgi:uncharacterized protein YneF (UPF0154 family)
MLITISFTSLIIGIIIGFYFMSYIVKSLVKEKTDVEILAWVKKVRADKCK